jgi:hypothetical protein
LPELAAGIRAPVLVLNPLDAKKAPLGAEEAGRLYRTGVRTGLDRNSARQIAQKWVEEQLR